MRGFIAQSGTASNSYAGDGSGSNFTYIASKVGCDASASKDVLLACMQSKPANDIISAYNTYNASQNNGVALSFGPTADNQVVFSNYTDRRSRGLFARVPIIYSTVNAEGSSLLDYTPEGPPGGQAAIDAFTQRTTCGAAVAAASRKAFNVPIWRVRYFGVWPNLNPFSWLGAYHSSDIPMIFGTSDLRGSDTPLETATSKYYQSAWATFARDPVNGLVKYGWPVFEPQGQTLVKLGNGSAKAIFDAGNAFDNGC